MSKCLLVSLALLVASPAVADWSPIFSSGFYQGTASLKVGGIGGSVTVVEPMGSTATPMSTLATQVYALFPTLKSRIDSGLISTFATMTSPRVAFLSSRFDGPIEVGLTGLSGAHAGLNQASVAGGNYWVAVRATGWYGILSYDCTANLTASVLESVVAYDPYTGAIDPDPAVTSMRFALRLAAVSCSTNFDFIPLFNELATDWASGKFQHWLNEQAVKFGTQVIQTIIPMGPTYLGLANALPVGKYVVAVGSRNVDVGAFVRDNVGSAFTGRTLKVTLGSRYKLGTVPGSGEPSMGPYVAKPVTFSYSDATTTVGVDIQDVRFYDWRWTCIYQPGRICPSQP